MSRSALRLAVPSQEPDESEAARLLTVDQVAKALSISSRGLYRLIERRRVPFYLVSSRAIRLNLEEVLAALRQDAER